MRRIPTRTALGALAFAGVLGAGAVAGATIGLPGTSSADAPAAAAPARPALAPLEPTSDDPAADGLGTGAPSSVSLADLVALVQDLGFEPADVMAAAVRSGTAAEAAAALGIGRDVLLEALEAAATSGIAALQGDGQIDAGLADGLRSELPTVLPFLVDLDARALAAGRAAEGAGTTDVAPHEVPEELEGLVALEDHAEGVAAEREPAAVRAAVLAGADAALGVLVDHGVVPAAGADSVRGRLPALLDAVMADVAATHGAPTGSAAG